MRRLRRLGRFAMVMCKPQVYATYALLWVLALEGSAAVLGQGGRWRPGAGTAVRAASVFLALLYLRMADEQKDLDYDRVHNPDRPLVRGEVTVADLRLAMGALALVLVALNVALSPPALVILLVDLGYALFLMRLEAWSAGIRDGLLRNLAVTYPVQMLLSVYVYVSAGAAAGWRVVPLIAVFACVFLHFEFARKTAWTSGPGTRYYSAVLGPLPSAAVAAGFAIAAVALAAVLFRGHPALLPLVAATLALPAAGWWRFRRRVAGSWPVPLAMGFVVASYLALAVQAGAA